MSSILIDFLTSTFDLVTSHLPQVYILSGLDLFSLYGRYDNSQNTQIHLSIGKVACRYRV